jgi:TIR domain
VAGPVPTAPGRIFISYRREETAYPAGWLYDRLADRFGAGQVFKDVDSIQLGDDFVEVITEAVGSCDVLLALIGDEWLRITDEHGRRRLDDPDDFVRLEIEAALTRKVRVIPILVDGARMPRAEELPDSLARLVRRQSLELSPSRFEFDTSRLLKVLGWTLAEARTTGGHVVPMVAGGGQAPDPNATAVQNVAERTGQAGPDGAASTASTPPGTPGGDQLSPDQGKPPGGRRRLSVQTRVLVGVGAALILLVVVIVVALSATRAPNENATGGQGAAAACIDVDPAPATSPDEIRVTGLSAVGRNCPVKEGDTITVSYTLTNTGNQPIKLTETFVGVRDEAGSNQDVDTHQARDLAPNGTVAVRGRVTVSSTGTWRMWPCYAAANGNNCPDDWRMFSVTVK